MGVEVMGSEGYLINEFLTLRTNQRDDQWGGEYANRMRFAVEVVRAGTSAVSGNDFINYIPPVDLDLVENGGTFRRNRPAGAGYRSRRGHHY